MNAIRFRRAAVAVAAAAALPLGLAACGGDDSSGSASDKASTAAPSAEKSMPAADGASMMDGPFGPACASVPKDGAGSFDGMAKDPVATAASNNPALSTLVAAVKKAGLVDTLNNAENITVFA
ncbi:fasciclin domain-containing protein, partial [Streptomyces sp. NPDC058685]